MDRIVFSDETEIRYTFTCIAGRLPAIGGGAAQKEVATFYTQKSDIGASFLGIFHQRIVELPG
jgi:asparagine synthetase A